MKTKLSDKFLMLSDKFLIFWSKLKACIRFLYESKSLTWVLLYEQTDKKTGAKTMTYQAEKSANMGEIYNLVRTGYLQTAKIVFEALGPNDINALELLKNDVEKNKIITEFLNGSIKMQNTTSPLKKMSKPK